jgi:hypothetical protein
MIPKRSRPGDGARGAAERSTFGGVGSHPSAETAKTEPLALVIEDAASIAAVCAGIAAELREAVH